MRDWDNDIVRELIDDEVDGRNGVDEVELETPSLDVGAPMEVVDNSGTTWYLIGLRRRKVGDRFGIKRNWWDLTYTTQR